MKIAIIGTGNVGSALGAGSFQGGPRGHLRGAATPRRAEPSPRATGATAVADAARGRRRRGHRRASRCPTAPVADVARGDRAGRRGQGRHRPDQPAQVRLLRARHRHRAPRAPSRSPRCCRTPRSSRRSTRCSRRYTARPDAPTARQLDACSPPTTTTAKDAVVRLAESIGFRPVLRRAAGRVARARGDGLAEHPDADADRRHLEHRVRAGRPAQAALTDGLTDPHARRDRGLAMRGSHVSRRACRDHACHASRRRDSRRFRVWIRSN